jgi:Hereditary spastic paraplegia protein strumpellin
MPEILAIGKLQILRRMITKQIHFYAKVECSQFESCLSTLNTTVINNLQEIRENAINAYNVNEDGTEAESG